MAIFRVSLVLDVPKVPALHARKYGTTTLALGPVSAETKALAGGAGLIAARLDAPSRESALLTARPLLEEAVDSISFLTQRVVHIARVSILDITPPLIVDSDRPFMEFATGQAESVISPKFLVPLSEAIVQAEMPAPHLLDGQPIGEQKVERALWWYIKGMDSRYAVDKFSAFWTSLELLWEKEVPRATEPYVVEKCKHSITNCPQCGGSVEKVVRGASLKQYLVGTYGVAPEAADKLWRIRQAVHGDDVFTAGQADEVGVLAALLRSVVLAGLKRHLGLAAAGPPSWIGGHELGMQGQMFAGGTRKVTQFDLDLEAVMANAD